MDKVVHFEIPVDNLERAKKFYSIFGWKLQDFPGMNYTGIYTVAIDDNDMPTEKGAINGGMTPRTSELKAPTIAINVESVDKAIEKAVAAGGKVIMPKKKSAEWVTTLTSLILKGTRSVSGKISAKKLTFF